MKAVPLAASLVTAIGLAGCTATFGGRNQSMYCAGNDHQVVLKHGSDGRAKLYYLQLTPIPLQQSPDNPRRFAGSGLSVEVDEYGETYTIERDDQPPVMCTTPITVL
jgi:hypothetical protein